MNVQEPPHQQLIWAVRLASDDSLPPQANSKKMVRSNIWTGDRFMIASELCQKVVEATGDWMLKIVRRLEVARVRRQTAVVINYGSGCASLVLVDGAPLPADLKSLPRVGVDMVVASTNSEKTRQAREDRLDEYGVLTPSDEIKDHLNEGQRMHPEGVRIYLHPNESDCGLEGFWGEDGERKRVFRIWSRQDDAYSVNEMTRSMDEEVSLRSLAANPSLRSSGFSAVAASPMAGSQPATPQAAATAAKGGAAAGDTASPSPFKPLPPRRSAVKRTIPTSNSDAAAAAPAQKSSIPSEIKTDSNGESKGASEKKAAKKAEANSEKKEDKQKPAAAKPAPEAKPAEQTELGFNPREIMLICRAFEGQMTEDELKKKTRNKGTDKAFFSAADIRQCRKILRALGSELTASKRKPSMDKKPRKIIKAEPQNDEKKEEPKEVEEKSKKRKRESGEPKEKKKRGRPKGSKNKKSSGAAQE